MNPFKQKDVDAQELAVRQEAERISNGFAQIAATPNGIDTLIWLMGKCGYLALTEDLDPAALTFNAGRRNIWLSIRRFLSYEVQIAVEHTAPVVTKTSTEDSDNDISSGANSATRSTGRIYGRKG